MSMAWEEEEKANTQMNRQKEIINFREEIKKIERTTTIIKQSR